MIRSSFSNDDMGMVRRNKRNGLLGDLTIDLLSSLERTRSDPERGGNWAKGGTQEAKSSTEINCSIGSLVRQS